MFAKDGQTLKCEARQETQRGSEFISAKKKNKQKNDIRTATVPEDNAAAAAAAIVSKLVFSCFQSAPSIQTMLIAQRPNEPFPQWDMAHFHS